MKEKTVSLLLFGICLSLCGCPYRSDVPLDKPHEKVNQTITGKWADVADSSNIYWVSAWTSTDYNVQTRKNKSNGLPGSYGAYFTSIGNVTFLNMHDLNKKSGYIFYKIIPTNNSQLMLQAVSGNIREQFESSEDLRKFFTENMMHSYFFDRDTLTLRRLL